MRIESPDQLLATPLSFIVIEGVNGAGKTTLQKSLTRALKQQKRQVLVTREPGSDSFKLGRALRPLIVGGEAGRLGDRTEMLLIAADRAQHVHEIIEPALSRGTMVLCDRYYYSSLAFQGYGRGIDVDWIETVNHYAIADVKPDLVILLDLDPRAGLIRTQQRQGRHPDPDTFEGESLDFHQRIRDGFLALADRCKEPFLVLDATESAEVLFQRSWDIIERSAS